MKIVSLGSQFYSEKITSTSLTADPDYSIRLFWGIQSHSALDMNLFGFLINTRSQTLATNGFLKKNMERLIHFTLPA